MTQFVCWVIFPVVLGLLSLGCGLLLQRAAGMRLGEGLLVPSGLAVIMVVAEVMTKTRPTARFTTPTVVLLALIGLAVARPWRTRPQLGAWPLAVAVAVYFTFLAPVLLSGEPTFTGFIKLDDTSTWMAMTDRVLSFGHDLSGVAPSTYQAVLHAYVNGGEPVGAMLPWGIGHQLVAQDLAWVFQPYLAFLGAMLALSGWSIVGPIVRSRALRAAGVFIAAQAALLYGYSLWGGIKEVAAAWLLALTVACAWPVFEEQARPRAFLPLLAASFAMLGVLGYGGAVWLCVTLIVVGFGAFRFWARQSTRTQLAALVVLAAIAGIGLIRGAQNFVTANGALTSNQYGNLLQRVRPLQVFGIWPAGDFRVASPRAASVTYVLILVVVAGIALGLAAAWRTRWWLPALYVGAAAVGSVLVSAKGSPWVQGKAFATVSPAALLVGLIGAAFLVDAPAGTFRIEARRRSRLFAWRQGLGGAMCAVVALGVLWSNALAYHHVTLAPYGQLVELEQIGNRFAGQGPTLINEFEPYAARHFLRNMDTESPSELRRRVIPLRNGQQVTTGGYADLDQFQISALLIYRTIVIRTSPVASRPPAPYRLVYEGRWYQVWQRPPALFRPVIDSIPLGSSSDASAVPNCRQVLALALRAPSGSIIAAAWRPKPWLTGLPSPLPHGDTTRAFVVDTGGVYELWIAGSFPDQLTTSVDGSIVGSTHEVLNDSGGWTPLGTVHLRQGTHFATLSYGGGRLAPGSGGSGDAPPFLEVGPLAVSPPPDQAPVSYILPDEARALCHRPSDWIETLGPGSATTASPPRIRPGQ